MDDVWPFRLPFGLGLFVGINRNRDHGDVVACPRFDQPAAIFVGDGVTLRRVVGKGDLIPSDLGQAQIGQHDSSPVFGGGVAINASGDIAFTAALHPPANPGDEWGTGVYVAHATLNALFANGFE